MLQLGKKRWWWIVGLGLVCALGAFLVIHAHRSPFADEEKLTAELAQAQEGYLQSTKAVEDADTAKIQALDAVHDLRAFGAPATTVATAQERVSKLDLIVTYNEAVHAHYDGAVNQILAAKKLASLRRKGGSSEEIAAATAQAALPIPALPAGPAPQLPPPLSPTNP